MLAPLRLRAKGTGGFRHKEMRASRSAVAQYDCRGLWLPGTPSDVVSGSGSGATAPIIHDLTQTVRSRLQFINDAREGKVTQTVNAAGSAWECTTDQFATAPCDALRVTDGGGAGYIPLTILTVCRPVGTPGSNQAIFGFTNRDPGAAAAPFAYVYRGTSNTFLAEVHMDGTSTMLITSSGWAAGHIYALALTSRTRTDHELAVCNLTTGEWSVTANTQDAKEKTAANPTDVGFGGVRVGNSNYLFFRGEINLGAMFGKSLATADLVELARNPFSLIEAAPQRSAAAFYTPSTEVTADLAATEAADTLSAKTTVEVIATLVATEGADTLEATGTVPNTATLEATEAADTLAATVAVDVSAALSVTEAEDAAAATVQVGAGVIGALGEVAVAEEDDDLAATVELDVFGDLAATEDGDTLAAFLTVGSNGPFTRRPFLNLH